MTVIWYHPATDRIFESAYLQAAFCALLPMKWDEVEILGFL